MENRKDLVISGIVIIVILSVVLGTIIYLLRNLNINLIPNLPNLPKVSIPNKIGFPPAALPTPNNSAIPTGTNQTGDSSKPLDKTIYQGLNFTLFYSKNWGLLTCSTSNNFEFDPNNSAKATLPCDFAIKPITVLVNAGNYCQGENTQVGPYNVIKQILTNVSIRGQLYEKSYRWCFNVAGSSFDITHRVSSAGYQSSSKEDFSKQVEEIIATITSSSPTK